MLLLVTQAEPQMLAYAHPHLGRLVQPFHYPRIADTAARGVPWAADNAAFGGFAGETPRRFDRMLPALQGLPGCLFVVCPDVVGDAEATDLLFAEWSPRIRSLGLPVAYVVQERGVDVDPRRIPWAEVEAIFIGCAEDRVKLGSSVRTVARLAKERGKWLHMGRVNSARRATYAEEIGCDSVDRTGWVRWRERYLQGGLDLLSSLSRQEA
jgi:hypothetical protein